MMGGLLPGILVGLCPDVGFAQKPTPAPGKPAASKPVVSPKSVAAPTPAAPTPAPEKPAAKRFVLSPRKAAELALTQSYRAREVDLTYRQSRYSLIQSLEPFDYGISIAGGTEKERALNESKYERLKTQVKLAKSFTSGTIMGLQLDRISTKSDPSIAVTTPVLPEETTDTYKLTLNQSLWRNFFGEMNRATVNAAELSYEAGGLTRLVDLQGAVMDALRQFWEAYVAKENYQEALASRDRYEKLVASVQRKASVGYTAPGELPQIQAELEARNQSVQSTSLSFVQKSDALALFLKLEPQVDLQFEIETRIPDPPTFAAVDVESLRAYRTQEKKVRAAGLTEKASESASSPELLFVGEATVKGNDASPGTSMSEATSGNFPIYYTGLQIGWTFGSGATSEKLASMRATRMIEENKLERLRRDLRDQMEALQLKIKANHSTALSSLKLRDLRQRVVTELNRTYAQGRTELRALIEAINFLSTAEVQYIRAIGDYQIALSEWSAFTDQLVTQKEAQ